MSRVLFLSILRFGWAICPDGWHAHKDSDKPWCYKAFESGLEKTWNAAESHCQSFGGDLTAVRNEGEQQMLVSILNRRSYDYYWIGLNDLAQTGKYEWVITDGSTANYDNFQFWAPGMPSDSDGARCTFMLFSDHLPGGETYGQEGKWVKGICNKPYKYICRVREENFVSQCPSGNDWFYSEELNKCYK